MKRLAILFLFLATTAHAAVIGSTTALVGTTITLTPVSPQQVFWWVQNNDTSPLTVTLVGLSGQTSQQIILTEAPEVGGSGQEIDAYQFTGCGACTLTLTSTKSNAKFSAGGSDVPYVQVNRNQ